LLLHFNNPKTGEDDHFVRRRAASPDKLRSFKSSCVILISEVEYEDHRKEDEPLVCELRGDNLNGTGYKLVRIKELKTSWARKNKVMSGSTTFFARNAFIDDDVNELIFPRGETVKVNKPKYSYYVHLSDSCDKLIVLVLLLVDYIFNAWSQLASVHRDMTNSGRDLVEDSYNIQNRNLMTGTKRVLVIRAVAADRATTASESMLSDDIFGTNGDPVNLKSQYNQCSDGKLVFQPLTSNTLVGSDGVYTVSLPTTYVKN
jgi:hypothetical protein